MIEIEKPRVECIEMREEDHYGKFVVEPLERGYGTTLGNSLRRILLSSLPGAAVNSIKIDGVLHEFSVIPGAKEDVTELVLNIKGIAAKIHTDEPKTVYIDAQGPCVVTAGDIKTDADIEILNPDLYIATLGEGAKLYMEDVIFTEVDSITTEAKQRLCIGKKEADAMRGKRVLVVDDVISTGESLAALEKLINTVGGNIVGKMAVLAEGDAIGRDDIIYLAPLPLFNPDGSEK